LDDLPLATGQLPRWDLFGGFPAAGGSYTDPTSGVTVWRISDAMTPNGNDGCQHFENNVRHFSLTDATGKVHFFFNCAPGGRAWFVDIQRGVGPSNYREPSSNIEARSLAFSGVDPHIAYVVDLGSLSSGRVDRFDVQANTAANTGNFPKDLDPALNAAFGAGNWSNLNEVRISIDDVWLTALVQQGPGNTIGVMAWNTVTDAVKTLNYDAGSGRVEVDQTGRFAYLDNS
jgi:hypothetical protein